MSRSVLVVDDEPNIVLSIKFLMKQQGYEVRTASNGEEALQALNEKVPDLILLDVMMPKPDGYEVCQRIRATAKWRAIPVIMLTAKGREVREKKVLPWVRMTTSPSPLPPRNSWPRCKPSCMRNQPGSEFGHGTRIDGGSRKDPGRF